MGINKQEFLESILAAAILLLFLFAFSCEQVKPDSYYVEQPVYSEWHWAECHPSLTTPPRECPGDKPLERVYRETGELKWKYAIDRQKIDGLVVYTLYCLDFKGDTVGTTFNVPYYNFPHVYDRNPYTLEVNSIDSNGFYSDTSEIWITALYNDSTGQIAPKGW